MASIQQSFNQMLASVAHTKIGKAVLGASSKVAGLDIERANERLENMRIEEAAAEQDAADTAAQARGFESASERHEFERIVDRTQPTIEEPSAFGESLMRRYTEIEGHRTGIEERRDILRRFGSPYVIGTGEGR